jgi:hypothetical protein
MDVLPGHISFETTTETSDLDLYIDASGADTLLISIPSVFHPEKVVVVQVNRSNREIYTSGTKTVVKFNEIISFPDPDTLELPEDDSLSYDSVTNNALLGKSWAGRRRHPIDASYRRSS